MYFEKKSYEIKSIHLLFNLFLILINIYNYRYAQTTFICYCLFVNRATFTEFFVAKSYGGDYFVFFLIVKKCFYGASLKNGVKL